MMKHTKNYFFPFVLALFISTLACSVFSSPELVFSPEALRDAQVGVRYEVRIDISQNETPAGGFEISEGDLPKGLTFEVLDEDSARIYGTPEKAGTYIFKTSVWCYGTNVSGQTGEKEYTLLVK